ncbi:hypothetical protein HYR69_01635 [Candidatus Sumerlaeota bacterium]|nr:hypothetical protein [Candidatus Sumerlaeota bacterium]
MKFRGITFIEIAFVALVLAAVLAFLAPKLVSQREERIAAQCQHNLALINMAKGAWGNADYRRSNDAPTTADILPFLPDRQMPKCPLGSEYIINRLGESAECASGKKGHLFSGERPQ